MRFWLRSRFRFLSVVFLCAVAVTVFMVPLGGQQPPPVVATVAPDEVLIHFRTGSSPEQRSEAVAALAGIILHRFDEVGVVHAQVPASLTLQTAVSILQVDSDVVAVQPNYLRHIDAPAPPNDPFWLNNSLWGLLRIQAAAVWSTFTTGSAAIVVADLDTGVNYTHPDLAANMWRNPGEIAGNGLDDDGNGYRDDVYGIDAVNDDSDPMDDNGHGTHTAGTIGGAGNNGIGVVGVNWNVKILACKFLSANGNGSDAGAIECFNYLVWLKNRGVNIRASSNSWGARRNLGAPFPQALKAAVDAAGAAGILNVFAAGNDGINTDVTPFDPASFTSPSILSVAASDTADNRASFSNYGSTSIDLAAPGVTIWSTYGGGYAAANGTSMAAPHAAGAAALVLAQQPALSVNGVKALLMNNVDPLPQWSSLVASGGRLNVYKAALANSPNLPPSVALTAPDEGAAFVAPASVSVAAVASDPDGVVARVDFVLNGTVVVSDTTAPYTATLTGVGPGAYSIAAQAVDNAGASATSTARGFTVSAAPPTGNGGSAVFVGADSTTQGSWRNGYGADGHIIVGDTASVPTYAAVTTTGQSSWTWAESTADPRALQRAGGDRVMACWFGSTFTIDLTVSGSAPRQVAIYSADYDNFARVQRFDLIDAGTGVLLDSRTISSFTGGHYVVWNVLGAVRVQVTLVSGLNAVVSGVFFGPAAAGSAGGSAAFVGTDVTTGGTWSSAYGGDGFAIAADAIEPPAYAQLASPDSGTLCWDASTSDPRALQRPGGGRLAACWYGATITFDMNVAGATPRQLAIYSVDYDGLGRAQQFDLFDRVTGALLDSRTVAAFSGGQYLIWNVRGPVRVQVTLVSGPNAVVSGLFFGPAVPAATSDRHP